MTEAMTPEEFAEKMKLIRRHGKFDVTGRHIQADRLLCKVLRQLGYGDGVKEFEDMLRWYE